MTPRLALLGIWVLASGSGTLEAPPSYQIKWGSAGASSGQFRHPHGLAVDETGFVYVADQMNDRIQVFTGDGIFIRQFGLFGTGPYGLIHPRGVAVARGANVYVANTGGNRIKVFTRMGVPVMSWGGVGSDPGQFYEPEGIALDDSGMVYVSDRINRIQKFTADGAFLASWPAGGDGRSTQPRGIATDHFGHLYVLAIEDSRVIKFTTQGEYVTTFGENVLNSPNYLATDPQGNVYVTDADNARVVKFGPDGKILSTWGTGGGTACSWAEITGIAVDHLGNVFVVDEGSVFEVAPPTCIQKFSYGVTPTRRNTWGELKAKYR